MRFRDGARGGDRAGALRPARAGNEDAPMIREFSAGGVVVGRFRGRPFVAVTAPSRRGVLALPKGHPDRARQRRGRRCGRCARRRASRPSSRSSGDVRYWYVRDGERVLKVVTFFLFRYRSGSVRDHDHEVESAEWVPLEDAPERLAYRGERAMAATARGRARSEHGRLLRRVRPQLLLARCSWTSSSAAARPPRSGWATRLEVPQGRGGADHGGLPALSARANLRGRHRRGRGEAGKRALAARHRARQPRVPPARGDDPLPGADLRPLRRPEDTVTVVHFSAISIARRDLATA